jgi:lipopolysaccharide export system permease protein
MRSAGMSMGNIISAVLKVSVVLIVGAWILGEGLAPITDKLAHQYKAVALSGGQALRTQHGTWMRDGNNFIHIQSMDSTRHLKGITRYEFDNKLELKKASFAEFAEYDQKHWVLYDIRETHFGPTQTVRQQFSQQNWVSRIDPEILGIVGVKDLDELSLVGLWQTIRFRQANALDTKPYLLAFWQKLMRPLATVVMMFLAIPFIFGPLRSTTMGFRMMVGVFVGFSFHTINQLFGPITLVYHIAPFWGACLPVLLFFLLGILLLRKLQ